MTRPKGVIEKFPRDYSRPPLHPDQPLDSIGRVKNMGRPKGARNMMNRKECKHNAGDVITVGRETYTIGRDDQLHLVEVCAHSLGDAVDIEGIRYTIVRGEDGELKLE